jgi:GNAT superfamily N-acetyltransferase
MSAVIRPFDRQGDGYATLVPVANSGLSPHLAMSAERLAEHDEEFRVAGRDLHRIVAEEAGRIAGYAEVRELLRYPEPGRLMVEMAVLPEYRRRGIGSRLFAGLVDIARGRQVTELIASVSTRNPEGVAFAERMGFQEKDREYEMQGDPAGLDREDLRRRERELAACGITVHNLEELKGTVPDWFDRLFELSVSLDSDIPGLFTYVKPSREQFRHSDVEGEDARHDAFFIALDGERWIGESEIRCQPGTEYPLYQELTGTLPGYRRQGIAYTLKLKGFEWARDHGFTCIRTWSNTFNEPMLRLNEKLGFVKKHADIAFVKELSG